MNVYDFAKKHNISISAREKVNPKKLTLTKLFSFLTNEEKNDIIKLNHVIIDSFIIIIRG